MANWTRGVAIVQFRAAGPVGRHVVEVADAISFDYLNIPQSPIPWATGHSVHVHGHEGRGPAEAADRLARRRRADARREDDAVRARPQRRRHGDGDAELDAPARSCRRSTSPRTGLTPSAPVNLVWSTVVGNRVNCTGTCWSFVSVPLGNGTAAADGTLDEQRAGSGRPRRLARHPAPAERPGQGAGAVLRQAQRRPASRRSR